MKKYILRSALAAALLLPTVSSCELDQFPRGSLTQETSWETVNDATNYYVGLLSNLRSVIGGSQFYVPEIQTDLFNIQVSNALNREHEWTFNTSAFAGDSRWSGSY